MSVNVRVELEGNYSDRERSFKKLFSIFKKEVEECNVMHDYKNHEYFESKSRKRRRKRHEAALTRKIEAGKNVENSFWKNRIIL